MKNKKIPLLALGALLLGAGGSIVSATGTSANATVIYE